MGSARRAGSAGRGDLGRAGVTREGGCLRWLGVAAFEGSHRGRVLLLYPFVSRPLDAQPPLPGGPWSPEHADAILVTHGHHEHYSDVPGLAHRLGATVYLPSDLHVQQSLLLRVTGRNDEEARWRPWTLGGRVELGGLVVEAYPVHREERQARWLAPAARQAPRHGRAWGVAGPHRRRSCLRGLPTGNRGHAILSPV